MNMPNMHFSTIALKPLGISDDSEHFWVSSSPKVHLHRKLFLLGTWNYANYVFFRNWTCYPRPLEFYSFRGIFVIVSVHCMCRKVQNLRYEGGRAAYSSVSYILTVVSSREAYFLNHEFTNFLFVPTFVPQLHWS